MAEVVRDSQLGLGGACYVEAVLSVGARPCPAPSPRGPSGEA